MKTRLFGFIVCFFFSIAHAQRIQIIAPKQPVVVGNAFQVQYIITDPSSLSNISSPPYHDFQIVSGPNRFKGNATINGKNQAIENITYTVVPLKTGTLKLDGISVTFKNGEEKSKDAFVRVIPAQKASFNTSSSYTDVNLYAPPSKADLDKLIAENLFVKTEVDKTTCLLGEPVVATFKLYSRLQSTSEVINAPSLYGFSVMDMININEAHQSVETINGKVFNTSLLRKLQLYPEQAGRLTIDPMQLQNEIEFDDSVNGKKTKVQKTLASNAVEIHVEPLPGKQPQDFSGAVGNFSVDARFEKNKIATNQEGKLIVTIRGSGNFLQFAAPVIHFPKAFDVLDPVISDTLNKTVAPTEGKREYVFSFNTDSIGSFVLPPVTFNFFDTKADAYRTVHSDSLKSEVSPGTGDVSNSRKEITEGQTRKLWLISLLILVAAMFFLSRRLIKRKQWNGNQNLEEDSKNYLQKFSEIDLHQNQKQVCFEIQRLLSEVMKNSVLTKTQEQELKSIRSECQLMIYSDVSSEDKVEELKSRTLDLLHQVAQ